MHLLSSTSPLPDNQSLPTAGINAHLFSGQAGLITPGSGDINRDSPFGMNDRYFLSLELKSHLNYLGHWEIALRTVF